MVFASLGRTVKPRVARQRCLSCTSHSTLTSNSRTQSGVLRPRKKARGLCIKANKPQPRASGASHNQRGCARTSQHIQARGSCIWRATPRAGGSALRTPPSSVSKGSGHRHLSFMHPSRSLGDIVKLHLLRKHSEAKIGEIWMQHHQDQTMAVGLTISRDEFQAIAANGTACPYFVFPMRNPKDPSQFYTMLSQYQNGSFFCCALEDYRKDPSNTQPAFVLSMFDDLNKDPDAHHCKNLVLIRGDIVSAALTREDGHRLTRLLVRFYSNEADFRRVLQFNKKPREFDFDKFMAECP